MRNWWKDLSVSTKLYAVVGLMAVLIAAELVTLLFAMNTLSSVRAFVEGEGLWSKAQKDAVQSLQQYAHTGESKYLADFHKALQVPLGDRKARTELEKTDPDIEVVRQGFIQGQIHPSDVDGVIYLLQNFQWFNYLNEAVEVWREADVELDALIAASERLRNHMETSPPNTAGVRATLAEIDGLNATLTEKEIRFSSLLGAGSRWLETSLLWVLLLTIVIVEGTGLFLTFKFSRNLSASLRELTDYVAVVGKGDFSREAPVRSKDELGQLATAVNRMTANLKASIGRRKAAESANQTKSMFLANMSHEIRTPLGVILGMIEILKDPTLPAGERANYIQIIERTGQNLTGIINDVLDISKVEAGHLMIEKAPFDVNEFVAELRTLLEFKAERTGNKLSISAEGDVPATIVSDRLRLRQIILNLVNNALKFTEDGKVMLTYGADQGSLWFRVTDTGIGIAKERQADLFQVFSQVDSSMTRKHDGTGLGLALSRRLAESMGGGLELERSEPDKGSTFRVVLPLELPSFATPHPLRAQQPDAITDAGLKGKRILLVDDSADNQTLIRVLLSRKGAHVDGAMNGLEGVRKARANEYDLVLMDIQMPILDGYEATRRLRQDGYLKPIVALTAHSMKEDRERCLNSGCNDYITKPIETVSFYRTITHHMSGMAAAPGKV